MSATTAEPAQDTIEEPTEPDTRTEEERLFNWQTWVHVGPGATSCEAVSEDEVAPKNECANPLHFHAWCHIPNQFEHEECRDKGMAARARRMMLLRDEVSSAYAILTDEIETLAAEGERVREEVVLELTRRETWKEYREALQDVIDLEEGTEPVLQTDDEAVELKPFANIYDDQARYAALQRTPATRDADEFQALERHIERFLKLVEERHAERMAPLREVYAAKDISALLDEYKAHRVRAQADEEFQKAYARHEWLICTLTKPDGKTRFASEQDLKRMPPEVYAAIQDAYSTMERDQTEVLSRGNS